jgi:hypothetical protein
MTQLDTTTETRRGAYWALSRASAMLSIVGGVAAISAWRGDRWFGSNGGAGLLPSLLLFLVFMVLAVYFRRKSKD